MSDGFPKPGTKVARVIKGKRETRWVIDQTLGGHVVYFVGRWSRHAAQSWGLRCTLEEWNTWAKSGRAA